MDSLKYKTLKQVDRKVSQKHFSSHLTPARLEWSVDAPNRILLSNGKGCPGTCIRCAGTPCMKFEDNEIKLEHLSQFPADMSRDACPTNAISWPYEESAPIIDQELCIGCGICVARCPTKAIYFKTDGSAAVHSQQHDLYVENKTEDDNRKTETTIKIFQALPWANPMKVDSDEIMHIMFNTLQNETSALMGNAPNLLLRNLLIVLGIRSAIRRTGDTNIRMDIILEGKDSSVCGVGEIEFGIDLLNTPRNSLDNIAVFSSRYKMRNLLPIIFPLVLPNQRSEYWQVIKDIKAVLNIEVRTVTLGALLILLWNKKKLSVNDLSKYTAPY